MLGAIIGDTVGSVYEFNNIKTPNFQPLFAEEADFTDDSILSVAIADWLVNTDRSQHSLEDCLVSWAKKYPCPMGGYGGGFHCWLFRPDLLHDYQGNTFTDGKRHPYNSCGNGSAMRVSACGWVARSIDEALDLAKRSAEITHNHPEGIKGAQATAAAIFLALQGENKQAIREYIECQFGYSLHSTCDDIRPTYEWAADCQGTMPPAIIVFWDSHSFEHAIRLAVSLGGDSDTLACITGGIAEAYYSRQPNHAQIGITREILEYMLNILPEEMWEIILKVKNTH